MQNNKVQDTAILLYLILFSFVGSLAVSLLMGGFTLMFSTFENGVWYYRLSILLQDVLMFFLPAYYACAKISDNPLQTMELKRNLRFPRDIFYTVLIFVTSYFATSVLAQWNSQITFPDSMKFLEIRVKEMEDTALRTTHLLLSGKSFIDLILNLLLIGAAAAFVEEVFFRGALQRIIIGWLGNKHLGVWVSAFIFSAIHLQFYGFFPRLFLGVVLGYLFLYSRNLWIPILFHFLNNAFVVIVRFFSDEQGFLQQMENMEVTWISWAIFALSLWCTFSAFKKYKNTIHEL